LLLVYAQLIQTQLGAVLNFLSSVPGPKGESALNFVMTEWVSRQSMFYGSYENKVRACLPDGRFAKTKKSKFCFF
jgi:hypothetical protein